MKHEYNRSIHKSKGTKNMKKYRVETDEIAGISKGTEVKLSDDWCAYGIKWGTFAQIKERNPEWFSPVEEYSEGDYVHVKLRTYGMDGIIRITRIAKNGSCPIRFINDGIEDGFARESIKRKATKEEIEAALIAEAKRRGLVEGARVEMEHKEHLTVDTITGSNYNYDAYDDALRIKSKNYLGLLIYMEGQWASIVDEPIQINGKTITFDGTHFNISCGDSIPKRQFLEFWDIVDTYHLVVYRGGEDITDKIHQLAEKT